MKSVKWCCITEECLEYISKPQKEACCTQTQCVSDFEGHAPPSILNICNLGFNPIHSMHQWTSKSLYKTSSTDAKYQTTWKSLGRRVQLVVFVQLQISICQLLDWERKLDLGFWLLGWSPSHKLVHCSGFTSKHMLRNVGNSYRFLFHVMLGVVLSVNAICVFTWG